MVYFVEQVRLMFAAHQSYPGDLVCLTAALCMDLISSINLHVGFPC
jgi:hypothetical protein